MIFKISVLVTVTMLLLCLYHLLVFVHLGYPSFVPIFYVMRLTKWCLLLLSLLIMPDIVIGLKLRGFILY